MAEFELTTDGENIVGPVSLDQVRRGLAAQKVPATAQIRRLGEEAWHPVLASLTWEPSSTSATSQGAATGAPVPAAPMPAAPPVPAFEASTHRWVVLAFVGLLVLVGLVAGLATVTSNSKGGKLSANSASAKAGPDLDPEAAAAEGFKLWDKEPRQPSDETAAVRLWEPSCEKGNASACAGMGAVYLWGSGKPKDVTKALELLRPACDKGVVRGCIWLGQALFNGWGVPKDLAETKKLWTKACDADEPRGCHLLGYSSWDREGPIEWRDPAAGLVLLKKACAAGYRKSCSLVRLDELRAKATIKRLGDDDQCVSAGKPPNSREITGGTYDENFEVASAMGCQRLHKYYPDQGHVAVDNWYCCP